MRVEVLRLGHRKARDLRTTTHVGLAARALGANGIILSGERDDGVMSSLRDVVDNWGGDFAVNYEPDWEGVLTSFKGISVHLTMYGLRIKEVIGEIRRRATGSNLLIVVGGEKVPAKVYELVDYNVSVTNQPHSEISSLAIFLDRLFEGRELDRDYTDAKRRIEPMERGKRVIISDG